MRVLQRIFFVTAVSFCLVAVANAADFKTVGLKIEGMSCGACVDKVQTSLKKVNGVKETEVTLVTNTAKVVYDPTKTNENALKSSVSTAGFKVTEIKAWDKTMTTKTDASEKAGCCGGGACTDKAANKKSI